MNPILFTSRQEMISLLPRGLRCAELGVFAGDFSRDILHLMKPSEMHMVDIFSRVFMSGDQHGMNQRTLNLVAVEQDLRQEFIGDKRVIIYRADSVEWLKSRPDDSLDFIYIDTDHSHPRSTFEITESKRAVVSGGWIAGHDYHPRFKNVVAAVDNLLGAVALSRDGCPSYLYRNFKPEGMADNPPA